MIFTVKQDIFAGIGHYLPFFVRASQVALGVKKAPAYAVDVRDTGLIPVSQELLEEGMATSSSILAWENLMYGDGTEHRSIAEGERQEGGDGLSEYKPALLP